MHKEDQLYLNMGSGRTRLVLELLHNANRTINDVSIFRYFEEYCTQLKSSKQDEKEVYWKVAYYEKLIDYIKIILAFETYSKALLIKKGFMIHTIDRKFSKDLSQKQKDGLPVRIEEFYEEKLKVNKTIPNRNSVSGLLESGETIAFSKILKDPYQEILQFDNMLVHHLKNINAKRNRLHLYSDFTEAFKIQQHISEWAFIKVISTSLIKNEFLQTQLEYELQLSNSD
ncbi:hypothetical protein BH11BAC2_BH11BAC2_10440 [soil metagenome]